MFHPLPYNAGRDRADVSRVFLSLPRGHITQRNTLSFKKR